MLRIGSRRAFTLIEVLLAATILSVGMIGIIRAYVTLLNGIEVSGFAVEASYLLKEKIADVEKNAIENFGVTPGTKSGSFTDDHSRFRWEVEVKDVGLKTAKAKDESKGPKKEIEENLSQVAVSVIAGTSVPGRRASLYTYLENYSG